MSRELHPEGFRISDRPIASSFANKAAFTTLSPHELRDEACVFGSQAVGGTPGVFAKYWDDSTIVNEKTFQYEEPNKKETTVKEKKKKKKEREQDACEQRRFCVFSTELMFL
jgi:RNA-binding protein 5/10